MKKLVIIIILLISNFRFYGVVNEDGEKVTDIQEIMQNENIVEDRIVENETKEQEEKETEEQALVVEETENVKVVEKITETVAENKESTVKAKQVEDVVKAKTEKATEVPEKQVEKIIEEKIDEKQIKETDEKTAEVENSQETSNQQESSISTPKCTNNKHGMDTGNCKTWFETKEQAIAFYNAEKKEWEDKWTSYQIDNDEYFNNRPNGYEIWDCPYCHKWTINIY